MNFENDCLRILSSAAARNGRWLSLSSCAQYSGVSFKEVWRHVVYDDIDQYADYYRYDYRIKRMGRTTFLAVMSRGYASQ